MNNVGVIVGRFQVADLHEGHKYLIDTIMKTHKKVIIFIGVAIATGTKENPLDFHTREIMLREYYNSPNLLIMPIADMPSDKDWSENLDNMIKSIFPRDEIKLYGSRDSFKKHYFGKFEINEIPTAINETATESRNNIAISIMKTKEHREGIIYAIQNKWDNVYSTVDAVIQKGFENILLCKKRNENKWRFVGGFISNDDNTAESALLREVNEELGLTNDNIANITYKGSSIVNDWRYNGKEKIMTFIFNVYIKQGEELNLIAKDDIYEYKWFKFENVEFNLMNEHKELWEKFYINKGL